MPRHGNFEWLFSWAINKSVLFSRTSTQWKGQRVWQAVSRRLRNRLKRLKQSENFTRNSPAVKQTLTKEAASRGQDIIA